MNKDCLISIIVPVYKVEKYLDRCVRSLVNQTYKNLEIILVDDGSPDNCPKMCDEWAKKDSRIKVIHKENGGLSDARNKGFEQSLGEYILFVDSDDYIDEKMVEIMYNRIIEDKTDMCICDFSTFEDGQNPNKNFTMEPKVISAEKTLKSLIYDKSNVYFVVAWNKLFRRELLEKVKFPKGRIHEDEFTCHRFIGECKTISCIYNPLYFYYMREGSITKSKFTEKKLDVIMAMDDRVEYISQNKPELLEDTKVLALKTIMALYCKAKMLKADKDLIKAIRKEYIKHYRKTSKKIWRTILGRFFPNVYYMLFKIKNSKCAN